MRMHTALALSLGVGYLAVPAVAAGPSLWKDNRPQARLVSPKLDQPMENIVDITINGYLAEFCGWSLPSTTDVKMKPRFAYRGVYMLPCWSAYDSLENWKRVLRFHSELTLNRNWFWLAGFPLLEQYGGEYKNSDLANAWNVNGLVQLCRMEGMKFYIGGGWFTWHHAKLAAGSIERGVQWYLDMLNLLPESEGIYIEPPGEGSETDEQTWRQRTDAFKGMAETIWKKRPEFEFAVAIGKFNDPRYRKAMHEIDDKRIYWWWCWGDPLQQNALAERDRSDRVRDQLRPRAGLRQPLERLGQARSRQAPQHRPPDDAVLLASVPVPRAVLERKHHRRGLRRPARPAAV
jgi:hypothetical protein